MLLHFDGLWSCWRAAFVYEKDALIVLLPHFQPDNFNSQRFPDVLTDEHTLNLLFSFAIIL